MTTVKTGTDPQAELILDNEANRPGGYSPYCMRCRGLVRMKRREPHYWRCGCGAVCDLRAYAASRDTEPTYEQKLIVALESSSMTPEDFGSLLATATRPVSLDPFRDGLRHSARAAIASLPFGAEILTHEDFR